MTGNVSLSPRKAYFKWLGKSFSSNFGGTSNEGLVPESISTGKLSNWWDHGGRPSFKASTFCFSSSFSKSTACTCSEKLQAQSSIPSFSYSHGLHPSITSAIKHSSTPESLVLLVKTFKRIFRFPNVMSTVPNLQSITACAVFKNG